LLFAINEFAGPFPNPLFPPPLLDRWARAAAFHNIWSLSSHFSPLRNLRGPRGMTPLKYTPLPFFLRDFPPTTPPPTIFPIMSFPAAPPTTFHARINPKKARSRRKALLARLSAFHLLAPGFLPTSRHTVSFPPPHLLLPPLAVGWSYSSSNTLWTSFHTPPHTLMVFVSRPAIAFFSILSPSF